MQTGSPQTKGGYPPPEVKLDVNSMTPQQLADEGEKIIFGGIGKSTEQGAVGKGQCTLCHTFYPEMLSERAPSICGVSLPESAFTTPRLSILPSHMSAQAAMSLADSVRRAPRIAKALCQPYTSHLLVFPLMN